MISYLRGKIKVKDEKFLVLDVAGVGYQIFVSPLTLEEIKDKEEVELFTYLYLREDAMELYGFLTNEEREFFVQLLTVSGVGPKSALGVLSVARLDDVKKAIIHGDPAILTKVSGIGKKTAERVIIELKNKIDVSDLSEKTKSTEIEIEESNAIDALVKLGYSASEARDALRAVDKNIVGVENRIKEALKILGR
jgi:Holliday junction DNA helicase RuvA